MILRDKEIVLRSVEETRKDWDKAFEEMTKQGDDGLLDQEDIERPGEWDEVDMVADQQPI